MASYFEPLIMAAIGTASKILSSQQQMAVLDQTKTLTESALQMLYTAKEAGGNPKVLKLTAAYSVTDAVSVSPQTFTTQFPVLFIVTGLIIHMNESLR